MNRYIVILSMLIASLSSCQFVGGKRVRGSGNVISQERKFTGFTDVEVGSAIHLYVKQDSVFSVKVETDDNLQDYIDVRMNNGTLTIEQEDNSRLDATGKISVYVSAPLYRRLKASGASEIHGQNILAADEAISVEVSGASEAEMHLKAPSVSGEMTGASKLRLSGQTKDLRIDGTGASKAFCFDLLAENTNVDLSGASHAEVFASIKLDADASGASGILYKGNATVSQRTSGAASVKKSD